MNPVQAVAAFLFDGICGALGQNGTKVPTGSDGETGVSVSVAISLISKSHLIFSGSLPGRSTAGVSVMFPLASCVTLWLATVSSSCVGPWVRL